MMPAQLVPARAAEPLPQPIVAKQLDWDFGDKPRLSVDAAIAQAIANNHKVVSKPPVVQSTKPTISVRTEPLHYHQCAKCGNVFGHTESSYGNAREHMCPNCGYGPNWRVIRRD